MINSHLFSTALGLTESNGNKQAWGDQGLASGRFQVHPAWMWTWSTKYHMVPFVDESWDRFTERVVEAFFSDHAHTLTPVEIAMYFHIGHIVVGASPQWDSAYANRFVGFISNPTPVSTLWGWLRGDR